MPHIDLSAVAEHKNVAAPEGLPEGSRNWELYRYACSLQARGISDEDMLAECIGVAGTMDPPLAEWEVLSVVRSAQGHPKGSAAGGMGRRRAQARSVPEPPLLARVGHSELLPDWSAVPPVKMARAWVMALFEPEDVVCVVADPTRGYRDGRGGELYAYAGQLADAGDPLLGRILSGAGERGLWAVVNPLDGTGRRRGENVTSFRNLLVECDELGSDEQLERICALLTNGTHGGPDTRALTWSGGKSWHAVVRVDAADAADFAMRKEWVYRLCMRNGFPVDVKCGNPNRLTRMAGAMRGDRLQRLAMCRRPCAAWDGTPMDWAKGG